MEVLNIHRVSILHLVLIFQVTLAQIPFLGSCPNYPVKSDFDVKRYTGKWYEIEKYFAVFEFGGTCVTATYSENEDGTVKVFNSQIQQISRKERTIEGTARLLSNDGSAKLGVTFPSVPFAGEANYWVLDTDYENYSIVWSCTGFGIFNFQIVWFLSRNQNPTEEVRKQVYSSLESLNIKTSLLQQTQQTNCQ